MMQYVLRMSSGVQMDTASQRGGCVMDTAIVCTMLMNGSVEVNDIPVYLKSF